MHAIQHPYVHSIEGIWYLEETNQLVTVQKFMERSLRDYLCEEYPYNRKRKRRVIMMSPNLLEFTQQWIFLELIPHQLVQEIQ